jgi:hypothetical protein
MRNWQGRSRVLREMRSYAVPKAAIIAVANAKRGLGKLAKRGKLRAHKHTP